MQVLLDSLEAEMEALLRLAPRGIFAVLVFGASIVLGLGLGRVVAKVLERGGLSPIQRSFFRRATVWVVGLFGVTVGLNILGLRTAASGLLAGGGITAVVLGFAFREIGENFLAGFLLAFSRPFKIGDIIQSGDFKGTVRSIEMRHTHIRTSDGRDIFLPNAQIVNTPLINFTRDGLLRPSFTVGIDYRDDAEQACELLREAAQSVPGVVDDPAATAAVVGLDANYVQLEVVFWIDTFEKGIGLAKVRTTVLDVCRRSLLANGFTVSSEVSTSVTVTTVGSGGSDVTQ